MNAEPRTNWTVTDGQTVSECVLEAVAAMERTTPIELERPLYEAIDSESLDAVVEARDGWRGVVEFSYYGYRVAVRRTDETTVTVAREET